MISPFEWLCFKWRMGLCLVFVLLTMAYGRYLSSQSVVLNGKLTNGMLDLVTQWSTTGAEQLLKDLGNEGMKHAKRLLLLDYVFLFLYPVALSLTCAVIGSLLGGKLGVLGSLVAWGTLLAGVLDAIENGAILLMLQGVVATGSSDLFVDTPLEIPFTACLR